MSAFVAPLCLTLINLILPIITDFIILMERWDYKSTAINNQIWRNFIAKEFNIIIFFLINVDMIVPYKLIPNSDQVVAFQTSEYPCPEVEISV